MKNLRIASCLVATLLMAILTSSCGKSDVAYSKFYDLSSGFGRNDFLDFSFSGRDTVFDAAALRNDSCKAVVTVRHTDAYPYKDLWLELELISPYKASAPDTLHCVFADSNSKHTDRGFRGVYEWQDTILLSDGRFNQMDCRIRHLMNDSLLPGLLNIGVTIVK